MSETSSYELVIPGDLIDDSGKLKPGLNTYRRDGSLYAGRLGIKSRRGGTLDVVPLKGVYDAQTGDLVIGVVIQHGPSNWLIDINGPYPAPMHVNEVPWDVGFAETAQYLSHQEVILCKILFVDEAKKVQVTMKDRNLRKLEGGLLLTVEPARVPRIIGKNGSMINLIKRYADVWLFVGQNGRIWINGDDDGIAIAREAIAKIENEAHIPGLTDRMKAFLQDRTGKTGLDDEEEE